LLILYSTRSENRSHHTGDPVEHSGLFFCEVACSRYCVPSEMMQTNKNDYALCKRKTWNWMHNVIKWFISTSIHVESWAFLLVLLEQIHIFSFLHFNCLQNYLHFLLYVFIATLFSSVWVAKWLLNMASVEHCMLHVLHKYALSFEWRFRCSFR
jgi:hypothetical protein